MPLIVPDTIFSSATFLELQNRVLDDRFDAGKFRTQVKGWLNEALGRIARRADIPLLGEMQPINTAAAAFLYDAPSNYARGLAMLRADDPSCELDWVENQFDILRYRFDVGIPDRWTIAGRDILLGPTPDGEYALELHYQRLPVPMVEDADTPEIPGDYDDLLVTYATAKGYRKDDDREMHDTWMSDFESDFARLKVDLREESLDGPVQVPGTFS